MQLGSGRGGIHTHIFLLPEPIHHSDSSIIQFQKLLKYHEQKKAKKLVLILQSSRSSINIMTCKRQRINFGDALAKLYLALFTRNQNHP